MRRAELNWRKHPMDTEGLSCAFKTRTIYCSIAFTRWTKGFQIYWRYLDSDYSEYVTLRDKQELDEWLEELGRAAPVWVAA